MSAVAPCSPWRTLPPTRCRRPTGSCARAGRRRCSSALVVAVQLLLGTAARPALAVRAVDARRRPAADARRCRRARGACSTCDSAKPPARSTRRAPSPPTEASEPAAPGDATAVHRARQRRESSAVPAPLDPTARPNRTTLGRCPLRLAHSHCSSRGSPAPRSCSRAADRHDRDAAQAPQPRHRPPTRNARVARRVPARDGAAIRAPRLLRHRRRSRPGVVRILPADDCSSRPASSTS